MSTDLAIAVIQLNCKVNSVSRNVKKAVEFVEKAAKDGARLICLPEAFATSMNLTNISNIAQSIPGETTNILGEAAKRNGVYIVAGILENDEGAYYSTSVLIGSNGAIISSYRRKYVFQLEKKYLECGKQSAVFETEIGKIGLISSYDLFYPEACRELYKENVEIIVCTALLPDEYEYISIQLAKARAMENSCYFVLASGIGNNQFANLNYMGNSMVIGDPVYLEKKIFDFMEGEEILAQAGDRQELIIGNIVRKDLTKYICNSPLYLDYQFEITKKVEK